MKDLYDWLSRRHHGLCTFQLFRQKLATLSKRDPNNKALYALLSQLADRYIEAFDEKPVPVAIADRAYDCLLKLMASLDRCASADGRLADLNRVAAVDLLEPMSNVYSHNPSVRAGLANRDIDVEREDHDLSQPYSGTDSAIEASYMPERLKF